MKEPPGWSQKSLPKGTGLFGPKYFNVSSLVLRRGLPFEALSEFSFCCSKSLLFAKIRRVGQIAWHDLFHFFEGYTKQWSPTHRSQNISDNHLQRLKTNNSLPNMKLYIQHISNQKTLSIYLLIDMIYYNFTTPKHTFFSKKPPPNMPHPPPHCPPKGLLWIFPYLGPDAETVSRRSGPCVTPECEDAEWVMTVAPVGYQAGGVRVAGEGGLVGLEGWGVEFLVICFFREAV